MPIKNSCILLVISLSQFSLQINNDSAVFASRQAMHMQFDLNRSGLLAGMAGGNSFGKVNADGSQGRLCTARCITQPLRLRAFK